MAMHCILVLFMECKNHTLLMETTNNSTSLLLYDNTSPGLKQRQEFCTSQGTAATFFTRVRQIHSSLQLMPSIFFGILCRPISPKNYSNRLIFRRRVSQEISIFLCFFSILLVVCSCACYLLPKR